MYMTVVTQTCLCIYNFLAFSKLSSYIKIVYLFKHNANKFLDA